MTDGSRGLDRNGELSHTLKAGLLFPKVIRPITQPHNEDLLVLGGLFHLLTENLRKEIPLILAWLPESGSISLFKQMRSWIQYYSSSPWGPLPEGMKAILLE